VTPAPGAEPAGAPTAPAAPAEPTRDAEAADSQELTAIVTDVRQTVPNKLVITLDNGQVWRQSYAERYPLQRGQKVWVRPSRWGGVYWLGADELNGYIQVRKAE
jgi:hypothetical protein